MQSILYPKIEIAPIFQKEAKDFIEKHHRHHRAPVGSIFQIAAISNGQIVGVIVVGRPVARMLQNGLTAEVTRLCTDGTKNVCSMLYAAAWRAAKALGYRRIVTYILDSENGSSLRASGWREVGKAGGLSWDRPSRPRIDKSPKQLKIRYEIS